MNVAHIDLYIPLELKGKRTFLRIRMDGTAFFCTGEKFENPAVSDIGFGNTMDEAVVEYLRHYMDYDHMGRLNRSLNRNSK